VTGLFLMKIPLFFLCEDLRLVDGRLDVIGMMDRIVVRSVPTHVDPSHHLRLAIMAREFSDEPWQVRYMSADGKTKKFLGQGFVANPKVQIRLVPLDGLVLSGCGTAAFEIVTSNEVLARFEFEIALPVTSFRASA